MSWATRFRLREHLRTALWPLPVGLGVLGLALGMIGWRFDRWARWTLLDFEHAGATALIAAIVGATLTFLGTAFSVLLVVVQFASTQLTPRAVRVSLSDPLYRVTIGLFVATFVFSMTVLGRTTERFIPQLAVQLAVVLALSSLGAYLLLVSHLRASLRPVVVAARVGRLGLRALRQAYPDPVDRRRPAARVDGAAGRAAPTRTVLNTGAPGLLIAFDVAGLVGEARRCDAELLLVPAPGDFLRTGGPLFRVIERAAPVDARRLHGFVVLGQERSMHRDPAFALRILVDVAVKALSPALNDPTTAVMALDQVHALLAYAASRDLDVGRHRDAEGRVRLTVMMPRWEDYLSLGVDEVRQFGAHQLQALRRLRALLDDLLETAPEARRAAVERELALLKETVRRGFLDPEDQARASEPDSQGLGSPARRPVEASG